MTDEGRDGEASRSLGPPAIAPEARGKWLAAAALCFVLGAALLPLQMRDWDFALFSDLRWLLWVALLLGNGTLPLAWLYCKIAYGFAPLGRGAFVVLLPAAVVQVELDVVLWMHWPG